MFNGLLAKPFLKRSGTKRFREEWDPFRPPEDAYIYIDTAHFAFYKTTPRCAQSERDNDGCWHGYPASCGWLHVKFRSGSCEIHSQTHLPLPKGHQTDIGVIAVWSHGNTEKRTHASLFFRFFCVFFTNRRAHICFDWSARSATGSTSVLRKSRCNNLPCVQISSFMTKSYVHDKKNEI